MRRSISVARSRGVSTRDTLLRRPVSRMADVGSRRDRLELGLFAAIESQTSEDDKRSLLAVQAAVRDCVGTYGYLEIGSHLGGSIQPHLLDAACTRIISIDKRPSAQPDERGVEFAYADNSTLRMLQALQRVSPDLTKLRTIDGETSSLSCDAVEGPVDLCFIDGEHTDRAALCDFEFCLEAVDDRGAIVFIRPRRSSTTASPTRSPCSAIAMCRSMRARAPFGSPRRRDRGLPLASFAEDRGVVARQPRRVLDGTPGQRPLSGLRQSASLPALAVGRRAAIRQGPGRLRNSTRTSVGGSRAR